MRNMFRSARESKGFGMQTHVLQRFLDSLLKFNEDGSCYINCPNRCRDVTYIDEKSTTNDLATSYILKNLLDTLHLQSTSQKPDHISIDAQEKKQPLNKCLDCMNEGSLYCRRCKMVFCSNCGQNHTQNIHFGSTIEYNHRNPNQLLGYISMKEPPDYLTLKNDRKDGKIKIICDEHNTVAEYYCVVSKIPFNCCKICEVEIFNCKKPICLYCKERKHRSHVMKTIKEQVETNKNRINEFIKNINIEVLNQNLKTSCLETEKSIASIRRAIQKEIKYRKVQQLVKYKDKLDKGEIDLIQRYDQVAQKQWEKVCSCEKQIPDKKDFEILVNKDEIIREIKHLRDPIPKLSVWLSDTSLEFPLGEITTEQIELIDFSARFFTCSIVDCPGYSDTRKEQTRYLENLEKLAQAIQRERSCEEPGIESNAESETESKR